MYNFLRRFSLMGTTLCNFLRRFSLMGTTLCAAPNKLNMPFRQMIMYILQCPHDIHVHLFCFDLHKFMLRSRAATCPTSNCGRGTSLFWQELVYLSFIAPEILIKIYSIRNRILNYHIFQNIWFHNILHNSMWKYFHIKAITVEFDICRQNLSLPFNSYSIYQLIKQICLHTLRR